MLEIKHLTVTVDGVEILKDFSLSVPKGEIHAIMGPNGAGKSTLAKVLAGHSAYEVVEGSILLDGQELNDLEVAQRAHLGLFLGFQYPIEIGGVTNETFLISCLQAKRKALNLAPLPEEEAKLLIYEKAALLGVKEEFIQREINSGFSGGEKKRNEILQMAVLDPKVAILDETDSGLDIDALRSVAEGVGALFSPEKSFILITHYQRLLNYIRPHKVHIMVEGQIVRSGGFELAAQLEEQGYESLLKPVGV